MAMKKNIRRFISILAVLVMMGGGQAMADFTEEAWYAEALGECEMSLGNNLRLKKVIERAGQGEPITIATIGGSVTEGSTASSYRLCWAKLFADGFAKTYGADGGKDITLVNSGVAGTSSTFGYMRYDRDVLARVPKKDPDGYPDLAVIEYAVNDWEEATGFRCYESMVRQILEQPNGAAVILLFTVTNKDWNMQDAHRKIGERYDLPMVSIRDGISPHLDKDMPKETFFFDEFHPNDTGHRILADAVLRLIADAAGQETAEADVNLDAAPVYGTDFLGLRTIYGDSEPEGITVERGGFSKSDAGTFKNTPVGQVCGKRNFYHDKAGGTEPLKITGVFRKCVVAWKATGDTNFGTAEVLIDGKVVRTVGNKGGWGQSEYALVLDAQEAAEHTLEIRVTDDSKRFTVTAVSVQ